MLSENEVGSAEMPPSYGRKVGERLRAIRRQTRHNHVIHALNRHRRREC